MSNWIGQKCASLYESFYEWRGYERLEGKERDRLKRLARDSKPRRIWVGGGKSRAMCGHVVISESDYFSYEQPEVEAIFLREVGHMRNRTRYKLLLYIMFSITAVLFLRPRLFTPLAAYGMDLTGVSSSISDAFMRALVMPMITFIIYVSAMLLLLLTPSIIKRRYEYRADGYAADRGYGRELISVLQDKRGEMKRELKLRRRRTYRLMHYLVIEIAKPPVESRIKRIRQSVER